MPLAGTVAISIVTVAPLRCAVSPSVGDAKLNKDQVYVPSFTEPSVVMTAVVAVFVVQTNAAPFTSNVRPARALIVQLGLLAGVSVLVALTQLPDATEIPHWEALQFIVALVWA